jgi:cytochrome c biogenesis protein CcmG, thiol:disulfide interchange protein DsbE
MQKKPNWLLIAGLSVVGLCLICCLVAGAIYLAFPSLYQFTLNSTSLSVGQAAPDFELQALDGTTMHLSDFQGKPVVLTFGATWCPDCRAEAPLLEELHQNYSELVVLAVDSRESADVIQNYTDEAGITYRVLLDKDGSVGQLYQVFAIPTVLFIDKDGVIQAKIIEKVTPEILEEKLPLIGVGL